MCCCRGDKSSCGRADELTQGLSQVLHLFPAAMFSGSSVGAIEVALDSSPSRCKPEAGHCVDEQVPTHVRHSLAWMRVAIEITSVEMALTPQSITRLEHLADVLIRATMYRSSSAGATPNTTRSTWPQA